MDDREFVMGMLELGHLEKDLEPAAKDYLNGEVRRVIERDTAKMPSLELSDHDWELLKIRAAKALKACLIQQAYEETRANMFRDHSVPAGIDRAGSSPFVKQRLTPHPNPAPQICGEGLVGRNDPASGDRRS